MSLNRMLSEWNDPQGARTMSDAEELIDALAKCCTQRGARMQIVYEFLNRKTGLGGPVEWWYFVEEHPEAKDWFDEDDARVGAD